MMTIVLLISLLALLTSAPQNVGTAGGSQPAVPTMAEPITHVTSPNPNPGTDRADLPPSPVDERSSQSSPQSSQQVVMRINGETVDLAELRQIYHLNFVMDAFLSREADLSASAQLDQFLNTKLVTQAANQVDFQLPAGEADRALSQWLTTHQKTQASLQEILHANGFTIDDFSMYFQHLYRVDTYLSQQERVTDRTRETLLQALQAQAQISFGAALDEFLTTTPMLQQPIQAVIETELLSDAPKSGQALPAFEQFPGLTAQELLQSQSVTNSSATTREMTTVGTTAAVTSDVTITPVDTVETLSAPIGLAPGNRAPAFSLQSVDTAQPVMQLTDWHGTPIVLSFWTTWCPYCRKQTPVFVAADQLTRTERIQFIGINVDESVTAVEPYSKDHAIAYPILLDTDGTVANTYAVRGYPTTYFLDADGLIVSKHVGALGEAELAQYLAQLTP